MDANAQGAHEPSLVPQFEQNRLSAAIVSPQFEHATSTSALGGGIGGTIAAPEGGGGAGGIGAVGAGAGAPPVLAEEPPPP